MTKLRTRDHVIAASRAVVRENPDERNPFDPSSGVCYYTEPGNPDRHCLAGTVLLRLGVPLPPEREAITSSYLIEEYLDPGAVEFLGALQLKADQLDIDEPSTSEANCPRRRWRDAWERTCRRYDVPVQLEDVDE